MLCYTSFFAIAVYRIAHELYEKGIPYMPRIMSELAHGRTGIDIHPGARIGRELCIDHGTGIVIGETTVIGDRVRIYQGVTLGAKSLPREGEDDLRGKRRHPTIGNDCVIYSGATILGGETVIGDRCVIGANVRLTHSVSSGQTVYSNKK
jgi:serine O-acetyltransferase